MIFVYKMHGCDMTNDCGWVGGWVVVGFGVGGGGGVWTRYMLNKVHTPCCGGLPTFIVILPNCITKA